MRCENCGSQIPDHSIFCEVCGHKMKENASERPSILKNRRLLWGAAGGILVIIAAVSAFLVLGDGLPDSLFSSRNGGDRDLMEGRDPVSSFVEEDGIVYGISDSALYTPDANRMFYADYLEENGSFNIYCYDVKKKEDEENPVMVVSGACSLSGVGGPAYYDLSEDGKLLIYMKEDRLYRSDLDTETLIDQGVSCYQIKNGIMFYIKTHEEACTEDYYIMDLASGGEGESLARGVHKLVDQSADLTSIYYVRYEDFAPYTDLEQFGTLYKKTWGQAEEKVANNVREVLPGGDFGQIFYTTRREPFVETFGSLIEDDMLAADQEIIEPDLMDYREYIEADGYYETETDYESYYAALERYEEKAMRDEIRYCLENTIALGLRNLFFYEKGEAALIGKDIMEMEPFGTGIRYVKSRSKDGGNKIRMSELESMVNNGIDIYGDIGVEGIMIGMAPQNGYITSYVCLDGKTENPWKTRMNNIDTVVTQVGEGTFAYLEWDWEGKKSGRVLYSVSVSGGALSKPKELARL